MGWTRDGAPNWKGAWSRRNGDWAPRDLGENLQRDDDGQEHTITRGEYEAKLKEEAKG